MLFRDLPRSPTPERWRESRSDSYKLIYDKGERLLVFSQRASSMFLLADGSLIGACQDHSKTNGLVS